MKGFNAQVAVCFTLLLCVSSAFSHPAAFPALVQTAKNGGVQPYGQNEWKQCVQIIVRNPQSMNVDSTFEGKITVENGRIVETTSGAEFVKDASTTNEIYFVESLAKEFLAAGEKREIGFCVAYKTAYKLFHEFSLRPLGVDDEGYVVDQATGRKDQYFVEVNSEGTTDGEKGTVKHTLLKRQNAGSYYRDESTGQVSHSKDTLPRSVLQRSR